MPDALIVTTKADLREIIRDALADALSDQRTPAAELMSAEERGKRIGVHARTVRNWVLHGCKHLRDGRKVGFRATDMSRCRGDHDAGAKKNEGVG